MVNYTSGNTFTYTVGGGTNVVVGGGGGGASWAPVVPGGSYVRNATPACTAQGCQAPELAELCRRVSDQQHELFKMLQEKERQMEPTRALWCEQDGHAFSEKDPGMQVMSIQSRDDEGKPVSESRTLCGPCAVKMKVNFGKARTAAAELPAAD